MKIVAKEKNKKIYYYLEHSYRNKNKIEKEVRYIGSELPRNIDSIKAEFMEKINKKLWYDSLDKVKRNFSKEFEKWPKLAREKYTENFLIRFTYNSNRIEGNTLTLKETARLLKEGRSPRNKHIRDVKEIENHKAVFELMMEEKEDLSLKLVLKWHRMLFEDTEEQIAGRIRNHDVKISESKFEPPSAKDMVYLLRKFFQWYHNNKNKLHPVEMAALVHFKFVTIHPFTDGNGRISRLIMNFILHKNKFPMLDIPYANRDSYYNALERSQVKNIDRIFVQYLIKKYLKEYNKYILSSK
jgi:Fic family protein